MVLGCVTHDNQPKKAVGQHPRLACEMSEVVLSEARALMTIGVVGSELNSMVSSR